MRTAKFWYFIFLVCSTLSSTLVKAQAPTILPVALKKTQDSLQQKDKLADWIYNRLDYSYAHPKESLSFLMNTQSEVWRKAKSAVEKEAWLLLLINQGYNQLYSGNILNSINAYEQAYNYWEAQSLNTDIYDYILKPWANNYTRLGDYEKAIFIQQKTLYYALKEHNDALAAAMYNNLAISYRSIGDFKKALEFIHLGIQKTPPQASYLILLNNTLADVYKDQHQLNAAEEVISKNISRQKLNKQDTESAYWLLSSYVTAGDIQLARNKFQAAEQYYLLGLQLNNTHYKGNRLREKAYILTQLGKIRLNQHQGAAALAGFNQTLSTLGLLDERQQLRENKIFGDNRLMEVFYQRALAYRLLGKEKEALENIRLSLLAADKIRFELADVKTKQRFQSETKQMAEKAISMAFALLEKTKQHHYAELILNLMEQTKARTLLDDIRRNQQQLTVRSKDTLFTRKASLERAIAYQEKTLLQDAGDIASTEKEHAALKFKLEYIEKQLREKYPALTWNNTASALNTASVLKILPANAHFIEFFSGEEYIYAIEIFDRQVKQVSRISNAALVKERVANFVKTYFHNGPDAMMNKPREFFNAARQTYQTLLGDFKPEARPDGKSSLIVIPDEVLGYLSFESLITDQQYTPSISNWPYLIKKVSLSYAFSIQTWINQSGRKKDQSQQKAKQHFAGLFLSHQGSDQQAIPAVTAEAQALKKLLKGEFLIDAQASTRNFFDAFEHANVLHISTHSYLSGLQKEPTLALKDDQVFLFELSARLNAPELVVLSACQTADGMMADGEGIISLSRGFAAIGTQGTLASLWNVNDVAAAKLTAEMYQHLLEGKPVSTALRQAKLNWLNTPKQSEQQYLPYYWDALIFMGYDQKIDLEKAGWPIGYLYGSLVIAGLMVTLILFIFKRRKTVQLR